ncbi:MAG: hypothetical protein ACU833_10940 [Gammaproteobacteria bacterium]
MRNFGLWIVLLLLLYGILEIFALGAIHLFDIDYAPRDHVSEKHERILKKFLKRESEYVAFDPELGWSIHKNGNSKLYQANAAGIRGDKDYGFEIPAGLFRITTFGDSFTHCDAVRNDQTWQAEMERLDDTLEVINFGVGGFGTDQAYLRYRSEGRRYRSDLVLIGFMSENIYRHVNTFRPFYYPNSGVPLTKPRFVINNGELTLVPNALRTMDDYRRLLEKPAATLSEIGRYDYYYPFRYRSHALDWSPLARLVTELGFRIKKGLKENIEIGDFYNEDSEAFQVTARILGRFAGEAADDGAVPIIVVFPSKQDVYRYRDEKAKRYAPLLKFLDAEGYRYIDLMDAFAEPIEKDEIKSLFKGHYSPLGNRYVAKHILEYLIRNGMLSRPAEENPGADAAAESSVSG